LPVWSFNLIGTDLFDGDPLTGRGDHRQGDGDGPAGGVDHHHLACGGGVVRCLRRGRQGVHGGADGLRGVRVVPGGGLG
jgi:hypothetical protein